MRNSIRTTLLVFLMVAVSWQTAKASERHRPRTKDRVAVLKQFRNSNAYAAPANIAAPANWSSLDEGAMSAVIAGR